VTVTGPVTDIVSLTVWPLSSADAAICAADCWK
jgi:hypothetical protein